MASRRAALQATRSGRKVKRTGTLSEYNERRDFAKTAEPKGEKGAAKGRRFVVQKHDATRLHYDLRLEHDGVLKSWAVTRGPSLVASDKRLAVQTEDHPMKYLDFEGVIPKGEYGGGTMIVWDQGTWTPEFDPDFGLKKGHLHFKLHGKRLKGGWHLVRLKARERDRAFNWLLMKEDDDEARTAQDTPITEEEDTSIKTSRTNAELERSDDLRADHKARKAVAAKRAAPLPKIGAGKKGIMPGFLAPQLANTADLAPDSDRWLHEIKFDGYRIQAHIDGGKVKLFTRKGLDWAAKFKPVAQALKALELPSAIIDGEIVVEDVSGRSDFSALQVALKEGDDGAFLYRAFDLLYADGRDLRDAPLSERKAALHALLSEADGVVRYSDHIVGGGRDMFSHACRLGLEGIVSKRADAPYRAGRGSDWLKIKCAPRQELVVVGWVPSTVARNAVGSLIMGLYERGKLVHVGRSGTGYTSSLAHELAKKLRPLERKTPPFEGKLTALEAKDARWVEPRLVAEVEMAGFTHDGHIRHAAFKGLRDDKEPEEVVRETTARKAAKTLAKARAAPKFALTHPDRVYWPEIGLTKQGLAEFYDEIADHILPHIAGRPLALVRCPGGITEQCFFAKHGWDGMSPDIHTQTVDGEAWIYIKDRAGLIALVQSGALEIHPWGSMMKTIEKPDRIIMDFDPGPGVGWQAVIDGALECRDRLKAYGLKSFVKTSGGKGLHVCAPLTPNLGWDEVKAFTHRIADEMAADTPARYVSNMAKAKRSGKIFIDYLRNGRGSTAVAAFSTRARAGAAVSTPIAWSELGPDVTSTSFTVGNLPSRLANLKRDPWAGFFKLRQTIKLK
ncbi:MAG: DNA ligase D [Alphaproteobacteria bacterium]|nr:DNA ligase D [Alphaproteobacteria bacterium]